MKVPNNCTHTKLNGERCRALALVGKRHCFYHDKYSDRNTVPRNKNTYALVPFEDTRSILFTINQLIYSFLNDLIDESKFTKTIYALQVAAQYANRTDALSPDAAIAEAEREQVEQEKIAKNTVSKPGSREAYDDGTHQLLQGFIDVLGKLEDQEAERQAAEAEGKARIPLPFERK